MDRTKAIAISGSVIVVLVLLTFGQRSCDRAGYWPHREEARVYTGADNWASGELRKCSALPREDGSIFFVGCVEGVENFDDAKAMSVTFWGRTDRPDRFRALHSRLEGWEWRCKKSGSSLTCYAVN